MDDAAETDRIARVARPGIEEAIRTAVRQAEGADDFETADSDALETRPLHVVRAANAVAALANAEITHHVRAARKAGHTWEEIAAALAVPTIHNKAEGYNADHGTPRLSH